MKARALVLGGGGIAGIAWELGFLSGLAQQGLDVRNADLIVGTSAGSIVGTLLRGGEDLDYLYTSQLAPAPPTSGALNFDGMAMMTAFAEALSGAADKQDARARIGALALRAATGTESDRRLAIEAAIGDPDWPGADLLVTAVDTADGGFTAFDREAGVRLLDAVSASCAVPTVWPPITLRGHRYMDGGMRSATNADLATGYERVLVVAPVAGFPNSPLGPSLDEEVAALRRESEVRVVLPDAAATAAFGTNPLDPATRAPSARAGRAQSLAGPGDLAAFWSSVDSIGI